MPPFPKASGPSHILLGPPFSAKVSQAILKLGIPNHPTYDHQLHKGNKHIGKWIHLLS